MIFILLLIAASAAIGYLSYHCTDCSARNVKISNAWTGAIISLIMSAVIVISTWAVSYNNYVGLEKSLAVIEQYKETVELYASKGVKEFEPSAGLPAGVLPHSEFTDLKYNNYQTQIGEMIREMRDTIVKYNATLTSKKVMKDNIFFNWLIYLPDKLKTIKMADYLN